MLTQHLNFVRTCEIFAVVSISFAIIYYVFGHYPTTKAKIVEMEEFTDENSSSVNKGPELFDTDRSIDKNDTSENQYDLQNSNGVGMLNDSVESLDD